MRILRALEVWQEGKYDEEEQDRQDRSYCAYCRGAPARAGPGAGAIRVVGSGRPRWRRCPPAWQQPLVAWGGPPTEQHLSGNNKDLAPRFLLSAFSPCSIFRNALSCLSPFSQYCGPPPAPAGAASERPPLEHPPTDDIIAAAAALLPAESLRENWVCGSVFCGMPNPGERLRCSNCQCWKGGKRGALPRKSPKPPSVETAAGVEVALLNHPNMPWKCASCGSDNGFRKLRCGMCQSWKNGKKQLIQRAEAGGVEAQPPPASRVAAKQEQSLPQAQAIGGAQSALQWQCHGCKAEVPGNKNRCPSCKSWRGGIRTNLGNRITKSWMCNGCKKENAGNKQRCSSCQCWRGGKRPGVSLKLDDQEMNGKWICEKCLRPNKVSKVRCGSCQRWRGGQRPDMKKSARAPRAVLTNGQQHYQPLSQGPGNHAHKIPPIQLAHDTRMIARPTYQQPALPIAHALPRRTTMAVTNPTASIQVHGQIHMEASQQNPTLSQVPMALHALANNFLAKADTAVGTASKFHWTCNKCTCDNLATEEKCRICEGPKE